MRRNRRTTERLDEPNWAPPTEPADGVWHSTAPRPEPGDWENEETREFEYLPDGDA